MKIRNITDYLERNFPLDYASDFDKEKIGLIIGSFDIDVNNIILTLDLTIDVVKEAIMMNANLIIAHHPYIFTPLYKVLFDSEKGNVLKLMFENNISLYVMHTNLDTGYGGINDVLANILGIIDPKVINGEVGKDNFLRYGKIKPMTLEQLAYDVQVRLELTGVRVLGDLNKTITTIGIVGGSGAHDEDIQNAIKCKCDCYITGEVKLPAIILANYRELSIIEVNHGVEKLVFKYLRTKMEKELKISNTVYVSNIQTDPIITISK